MEFQKYFQSFNDYFWEWENGVYSPSNPNNTIVIPNGVTIGYEQYIFEVLELLSEESIPPFGSFLLAVIATNNDNYSLMKVKEIVEKRDVGIYKNAHKLTDAFTFLTFLSRLPDEYKTGEKRKLVFATIFRNCHNKLAASKSKNILGYLNYKENLVLPSQKIDFNETNFIKDFRTIALLRMRYPTTQSIIDDLSNLPIEELKNEIGEESIIQENEISREDLVKMMLENNTTFHVGSLIKRIWAGLNIKLHHNSPSGQPLGGVSDITNKGNIDQLLLSEFANEDDVFMQRIANNEALYIQREVPPEANKQERTLLVDTSLMNWGNERTINLAIAIAIATHPKTDYISRIFGIGYAFDEIKFNDIHQVVNGVNRLSTSLDCSNGLNSFMLQISKNQEVFLITNEDSLKQESVQKSISDNYELINYIISTQIDGTIQMYKCQNRGRKHLQRIQLNLEELWAKENNNSKKNSPINRNKTKTDVPILYPLQNHYHQIFMFDDNYYVFFKGILFQFYNNSFEKGYIKIADNIPFDTGKFAMFRNSKNELILVNYYDSLQFCNLKTKELKIYKTILVNLKLFSYLNKIYAQSQNDLYEVLEDGVLEDGTIYTKKSDIMAIEISQLNDEIDIFIYNFKNSKQKYTIFNSMNNVMIDLMNELNISINNKKLFQNRFISYTFNKNLNTKIEFTKYEDLYFKRAGDSKIETIKVIKEQMNLSLKEAHEIVDHNNISLLKINLTESEATSIKNEIEKTRAVCFTETNHFESKDGSIIRCNNSILEFESSDQEIPIFYIPFVQDMPTAFFTENEFAGNNYFLPDDSKLNVITVEEFNEKYITPFINRIASHELNP